jgi:dipeptidyl aminopeptidase/acylaminoacyl peptidase
LHLDEISPAQTAAEAKIPILLIHGCEDSNISIRHSRLILKAANNKPDLWEVPNANHCGSFGHSPEQWEKIVIGWLDRVLRK